MDSPGNILEGTVKCKNKKQEVANAKDNETVKQGAAAVTAAVLEGTEKCKKRTKQKVENAKDNGPVEQETASVTATVLEGTEKCKKKKRKQEVENAKENVTVEQETGSVAAAVLEGTEKCKKRKKRKAASVTATVLGIEGTPRCKVEEEKAKERRGMAEWEATTTTTSEGIAKSKKKNVKAKERVMMEQEATTSLSALDKTLKCKNEEKKKERVMVEQGTTSAVSGIAKCNKKNKKAKERRNGEQEATATTVLALDGALKCKKKKKAKENVMDDLEPAIAISVSASEGTIKCKRKKLKKKNKMQDQQESTHVLSGLAVDKIVANNPGNGCANGEGASGDIDVSMDPINADDPNCSKSKDANDKVCEVAEAQEGNKNCYEKFSPLQEGAEDGNRKRKRDMSSIYSPRGSLIRFHRKKLLILDLNGLLADINMDFRNAHRAHAKVKGKLVFRRPYCDDFLRFCFQNFELGIWSSRKMENVNSVVDILMHDLKQYLLFCWDMSKCTSTGCSVIGNMHKPLVLKELKKLWNKEDPNLPWEQGEFSPSNTLLVDDSPYKALCNPPHTAIFPQPYSYLNRRDDSLGPGGDLRVYLEKLAAADDVQVFVRDNLFGQPSITELDPKWKFYAEIVNKVERALA